MVTAFIIIIVIVIASKKLLGPSEKIKKIGPTFLLLLLTTCMFIAIASIMNIGSQSKFKFALALAGCIGFFIIDANLILSGTYTKRGKKQIDINEDDFIYASMKLFMDFILIFLLLVECFTNNG